MKRSVNFGDRILQGILYTFLVLFSLFCLYPFLLVLGSSFSAETSLMQEGYRLIPRVFSLDAYRNVFANNFIYKAYYVSVITTAAGTVASILLTSALSYAISVKTLRYRNRIALYVYITMLFSGGLVPYYMLIAQGLRLRNSIWVLVIPMLLNPFFVFLLKNFFSAMPESLGESAKIDGANDIFILFKIILPLSLPALATIALFYALNYWNQYYLALLFIDDRNKFPLQYLIMQIVQSVSFTNQLMTKTGITKVLPSYTVRLATAIVTIGPIVFLYPFLQKYFVKGLVMGAVKG